MATRKVQQSGRQIKVVVSGEPQEAFDTDALLAEVGVEFWASRKSMLERASLKVHEGLVFEQREV